MIQEKYRKDRAEFESKYASIRYEGSAGFSKFSIYAIVTKTLKESYGWHLKKIKKIKK